MIYRRTHISHLSVAEIKKNTTTKSNLQNKEFISAHSSRGGVHNSEEDLAARSQSRRLTDHMSTVPGMRKSRKCNWARVLPQLPFQWPASSRKPVSSKGSITYPNSTTNWRPIVQAHEPVGDITHSKPHSHYVPCSVKSFMVPVFSGFRAQQTHLAHTVWQCVTQIL